jgi:hypothetical protein
VYWFLQSGWWLLHTSPQLHPDPWTWTSQGLPDCINPLGPEHCNQTLHCREGSAFPRMGKLHWSLCFLDDFIALYLTFGLGHTKGDDISRWPPNAPYLVSDHQNFIVFIHLEHADWDPTKQYRFLVEGFVVPSFN